MHRGAVGDRKNTQWKKKVLATRPNKLHAYKLTIFPLTFERYISFPFRAFFFLGGKVSWWFLIITCQILPHDLRKIYHLPFRVEGVLRGILMVPHQYMVMNMMMMMVMMMMMLMLLMLLLMLMILMMMMVMMMIIISITIIIITIIIIIANPGKRWRRTVTLLTLLYFSLLLACLLAYYWLTFFTLLYFILP